jgi:NADPH-dependent F420 reductase
MIGFLGGTGPEGRSLALRLALAGETVMVGSRDPKRAQEAAQRIQERAPSLEVRAGENGQVVRECDPVFITVPYQAQRGLLAPLGAALAGKRVVTTVAPLEFQEEGVRAVPVPAGSAALEAQGLLPDSQVVAAFHTISATDLWVPSRTIEGDVVVCSDHREAREQVMGLVRRIPKLRAVDGGPLANAVYVEGITALLLNINRIHGPGTRSMIRIVGV